MRVDTQIGPVTVRAYTIPTDAPEADGTYAWQQTTLVVVATAAAGRTGSAEAIADLVTGARKTDENKSRSRPVPVESGRAPDSRWRVSLTANRRPLRRDTRS